MIHTSISKQVYTFTICNFVYLFTCLLVYLFTCLLVYLFTCLLVYLFTTSKKDRDSKTKSLSNQIKKSFF